MTSIIHHFISAKVAIARISRRLRRGLSRHLYRQLPLAFPTSMHIDPCNMCNFRCVFCPTGDPELLRKVKRPAATMSLALYTKVIDDVVALVRPTRQLLYEIHLYKDGEPLLNKQLPEMIQYAKSAQIARVISTTTNGSLLDDNCAANLIKSGLDCIRISIEHPSDQGYKEVTRNFADYKQIKNNVENIFRRKTRACSPMRIIVKTNDVGLTDEQRDRFVADFRLCSDEIRIDTLMGWSRSDLKDFTLGREVGKAMDSITPLSYKSVCPEPFRKLVVNADGSVSVCCVDWSHATVVGNVRANSLAEIWNGEELREFRIQHLRNRRSENPACASCQYLLGFAALDNLDSYASALLSRYTASEADRV